MPNWVLLCPRQEVHIIISPRHTVRESVFLWVLQTFYFPVRIYQRAGSRLYYIFQPAGALTEWQIKGMAIAIIVVLSLVNMMGVKKGGNLQSIFMIAKLVPIGIIIVCGLVMGKMNNPMDIVPGEGMNPLSAFALAIVAALWAFDGWSSVYIVSEELKNPKKRPAEAVIIGVLGVTIVYVLFNLALLKVLPIDEIVATEAPGSMAAQAIFGKPGAVLVTVGALIAIFGSCNGCILAYPREYYAMAKRQAFL